jgi:hypothetical protein
MRFNHYCNQAIFLRHTPVLNKSHPLTFISENASNTLIYCAVDCRLVSQSATFAFFDTLLNDSLSSLLYRVVV